MWEGRGRDTEEERTDVAETRLSPAHIECISSETHGPLKSGMGRERKSEYKATHTAY